MKHCAGCNNFFSDETEKCPNDGQTLAEFDLKSLVGKTLDGKYQIEALLGMGGMGAVFRARHTFIGNDVAVKVIHPEMAMDRSIVERFLREARAAATIDHPNAIRVSDFGRCGDMLYLVMEFIQGESMKDYLEKKHWLTPGETAIILSQVCAALDIAHEQGIVHRDLKPDNIMLKTNSRGEVIVKVVDFGIAKVKAASDGPALTNVGMIIGTANYMSPEQCQGQAIDHRSDIYSLGIIAYEALGGECPFTAENGMQVIVKHIIEAPPSLRSKNPAVAPEIEKIVMRAMEKKPENRYSSAVEFATDLVIAAGVSGDVNRKSGPLPSLSTILQNESTTARPVATPMAATPADNGRTVIGQPAPVSQPAPHQPAFNNGQTIIGQPAPPPARPVVNPAARNDQTVIGQSAPSVRPAPANNDRTVIGQVAPVPPARPIANDQTVIGQVAPVPPARPAANPAANNNQTVIGQIAPPPVAPAAFANNQTVIGQVAPIITGQRPKLLIVNDSKSIVILLKHQMQQAGFDVVTQSDSMEAPVTIMKERPDMIILGFEMAKLSGPDLCNMIKTKPSMAEFAHLPVFLYSSMEEAELSVRVQECHANGYIHKTWTTETIKAKLAQYINRG